ncbi:methionine aminopeptidase 1 isoform 1-T1 [Discoglossus pictus]
MAAVESRVCETEDCTSEAKLQCPTCIKLGIQGSYFCSQECFKGSWATHKLLHKKAKDDKVKREVSPWTMEGDINTDPWPGYRYTGKLRPHYPLMPMRPVPSYIQRPDYADHPLGMSESEQTLKGTSQIKVLSPDDIEGMRVVCKDDPGEGPSKPRKNKINRNPPFTEEENLALMEGVRRHWARLYGKMAAGTNSVEKNAIWASINQNVNAAGTYHREIFFLKKRLADIKQKVKKKVAKIVAHQQETGGGPPLEVAWLPSEVIMRELFIPHMAHEIPGLIDSGYLQGISNSHLLMEDTEDADSMGSLEVMGVGSPYFSDAQVTTHETLVETSSDEENIKLEPVDEAAGAMDHQVPLVTQTDAPTSVNIIEEDQYFRVFQQEHMLAYAQTLHDIQQTQQQILQEQQQQTQSLQQIADTLHAMYTHLTHSSTVQDVAPAPHINESYSQDSTASVHRGRGRGRPAKRPH